MTSFNNQICIDKKITYLIFFTLLILGVLLSVFMVVNNKITKNNEAFGGYGNICAKIYGQNSYCSSSCLNGDVKTSISCGPNMYYTTGYCCTKPTTNTCLQLGGMWYKGTPADLSAALEGNNAIIKEITNMNDVRPGYHCYSVSYINIPTPAPGLNGLKTCDQQFGLWVNDPFQYSNPSDVCAISGSQFLNSSDKDFHQGYVCCSMPALLLTCDSLQGKWYPYRSCNKASQLEGVNLVIPNMNGHNVTVPSDASQHSNQVCCRAIN